METLAKAGTEAHLTTPGCANLTHVPRGQVPRQLPSSHPTLSTLVPPTPWLAEGHRRSLLVAQMGRGTSAAETRSWGLRTDRTASRAGMSQPGTAPVGQARLSGLGGQIAPPTSSSSSRQVLVPGGPSQNTPSLVLHEATGRGHCSGLSIHSPVQGQQYNSL